MKNIGNHIDLCARILLFCGLTNYGLCGQVLAENVNVVDLGNQHYQIGEIHIDKVAESFTVSGKIIRKEPPLEFLAVSKGGHKAYESLIELESSAKEFNIACILIGLDNEKATLPAVHFDKTPVEGDKVKLTLGWHQDGETITVDMSDIMLEGSDKPDPSRDWRYTGSYFSPNGDYMAELTGAVIGFVHDQHSIIQHREGIGLNNYGGAVLNKDLVPEIGVPVTITVEKL